MGSVPKPKPNQALIDKSPLGPAEKAFLNMYGKGDLKITKAMNSLRKVLEEDSVPAGELQVHKNLREAYARNACFDANKYRSVTQINNYFSNAKRDAQLKEARKTVKKHDESPQSVTAEDLATARKMLVPVFVSQNKQKCQLREAKAVCKDTKMNPFCPASQREVALAQKRVDASLPNGVGRCSGVDCTKIYGTVNHEGKFWCKECGIPQQVADKFPFWEEMRQCSVEIDRQTESQAEFAGDDGIFAELHTMYEAEEVPLYAATQTGLWDGYHAGMVNGEMHKAHDCLMENERRLEEEERGYAQMKREKREKKREEREAAEVEFLEQVDTEMWTHLGYWTDGLLPVSMRIF